MPVLEQQARSFFLACRLQSPRWKPSSLQQRASLWPQRKAGSLAQDVVPEQKTNKPYYVTSPIFYVNAAPHAGHLYTLVLTDILKRWQLLTGDSNATLLTGTDEHGMKIQKAALKAKTEVKSFCDQHAKQFRQLSEKANISFDRFIRTTDVDHQIAVEHVWRELKHRGYIYEANHTGWYSVSDETFYPESQVHLVLEPSSGRKMHASMETGKEVEWTSETNYHFKLSEFKDKLLEFYEQNPNFIVPKQRMNYIIKEVEAGLLDLSISRPRARLPWGIGVPGDETQTVYVWLDALMNYLTMTGYPSATQSETGVLWPPNCQVIGKDIVRFHCIYWPAFLLALGLPLPQQFLVHAHWNMNNEKMSKSAGNGVNPFYAMDRFGVDTIRYYMARDGGYINDAEYENSFIIDRYKKELQGSFGNLLSRIVRAKKWDLRKCIQIAGENPELPPGDKIHSSLKHQSQLINLNTHAQGLMKALNIRQVLHTIMQIVARTNKYFHAAEVWKMVDEPHLHTQQEAHRIIYISAESLRIAAILLQPFMPEKMNRALDMLGVDKSKRSWEYTFYRSDFSYGVPLIELGKAGVAGTLFPPLSSEY